jgi:hypothetical protein
MSTFVPSTIVCRCGERYTVEVADGLHLSLRPDVRQQILDGTFHRFFCPACGMTTMIDKLIAFTDFPRRQWFTIAPSAGMPWRRKWLAVARDSFEATMVHKAPELVVGWGNEMTRRLIFGLASLREKLIAGDAGLDDRVVELLKIQLVRDLRDRFSADDYFHLVAVTAAELVLERTHRDGMIRKVPIPRGMYDALAAEPELPKWIELAFPDGLIVDHRAMLVPEAEEAETQAAAAPPR